jgi:CheY-like chemotaxis protein
MPDPAPAAATILVAEDDAIQRQLYVEVLVHAGYRVLEAADGAQAMEIAHERRPDLVIVDVSMPGMSGWNVVRQLREDYSLGALRVVMVTGLSETWDRDASIAAGADSHLTKPLAPERLLAEIKRVLGK